MSNEPAVLRPADVAARLGVTTGRIYQLIRAREIPAVRIGGALRIPVAAWDQWLEEQHRGALASARRVGRAARSRGSR